MTDGSFCDLIHRDPVSGSLWRGDNGYVIGTNINIGAQKTDGIDLTLNYNQPIQDWGSLGVTLVGTYLNTFEVDADSGLAARTTAPASTARPAARRCRSGARSCAARGIRRGT